MRRLAAGLAALAGLTVGVASATAAQSALAPGVHIDPGSPAGKQYAIPVASARSETAGFSGPRAGGSPPLFGVGITKSVTATATAVSSGQPVASSGTATGALPSRGSGSPLGSTSKSVGSRAGQSGAGRSGAGRSGAGQTVHGSRAARVDPVSADASGGGSGGSEWLALAGGGALVLILGGGVGIALRRRAI
ncbi:MAG: hypothetical protein ACYC91_10925 [Solirubrobacteraceae bacterium]